MSVEQALVVGVFAGMAFGAVLTAVCWSVGATYPDYRAYKDANPDPPRRKVLPPQGGSGTAPVGRRCKCPEAIDPKMGLVAVRPDRGIEYSHEAAHRNAGCKTCRGTGWIILPEGWASTFPPPAPPQSKPLPQPPPSLPSRTSGG